MLSPAARAAAQYKTTDVQCGTPLELVVKLYDGAITNVVKARDALARGDLVAKRDAISRSLAIIAELQSSLDVTKGGEIAASLDSLYIYVTNRLVESNVKKDPRALDEVHKLLVPLRDAWQQIASAPPPAKGTP
jgi:flagellar secretion chaperone FliS